MGRININLKKIFSDREVKSIGNKVSVVSMSNDEQENLVEHIFNEDHEFFYEPETNQFAIKIEWRGTSLGIPAFETWTQARTYGLGQNEVITRTCRLDGGGTKEFYIPVSTNFERRVN